MKYLLMFDEDNGNNECWNPNYMEGYELYDTEVEAEKRGKQIEAATNNAYGYMVVKIPDAPSGLPRIVQEYLDMLSEE